ncbi:MAG: carboxypeptidase M32 [Planctomycetaceae bacterium]|nr:carboxypeptidase M32 [Planctomycetaceae bacterium]MBP63868.1 carboxypeptidase M32 [Planctomycetaceae bacterium]
MTLSSTSSRTFDQLCNHFQETTLLHSANSLLEWDERTKLPTSGGPYRAEQITYLAGLIHQRETDLQVGAWLEELEGEFTDQDASGDKWVVMRELRRQYDKKTRLPQKLVEGLTRASVLGQQAWVEARKNDDFAILQPLLDDILKFKREQAECLGYEDVAYDALLDEFEPGEKTANVTRVLENLREELVPLVAAIQDSGKTPSLEILNREYCVEEQRKFGESVAAHIGFDFSRGRLDVTDHPFCSSMGPHDCRITTRYDAHYYPTAFFGILHEAGHGMYDQGLRADWYGLPPGSYVSLGIHESQSRMWENLVGRSYAFWQHFFPAAQAAFPTVLQTITLDDFYFAINDVRPSLIRVEADEATYNLHIIVRFELEQALIAGNLSVADLPDAWDDKYQQCLGIRPANRADGVLQDIHWSAALIGYFPTYSLGNLYASQLFDKAEEDLGNLNAQFLQGEFQPLLRWLRKNVHSTGQRYPAADLVHRITGTEIHHGPLMKHLRDKLEPLYGL